MPTETVEAPALDGPAAENIGLEAGAAPAAGARTRHLPAGESVARGALALLGTQPLTWASTLLATIALPRLLGADLLGQVTIAITISGMAATLTSLGISEYLVRRFAQHPASLQRDAGIALLVQTISTVLGAVVIGLFLPAEAFSLGNQRLLIVALALMLVSPAQTILLSSFRGREMHAHYAWFNAAGAVSAQVCGVVALLLGADVVEYVGILGAVTIGATVVGWKLSDLRPTLPTEARQLIDECRQSVVGGFPFLAWLLTQCISGADRVLLGMFVPAAEVGWYAAASRIIAVPIFLPTLIITPLFPALSRSTDEPATVRRTVAQTARALLLLVVPLSAGTIVIAPAIPSLLGWPSDFGNAIPLISLLSLQLPVIALDMVFGTLLMAIGRQGRWVIVGMVAAALKVGLNLVAIPLLENLTGNGAIGASIVTLICEIWMFVGAIILIPKHLLDFRTAWDTARVGLAGVAVVVVGSALSQVALVLAIAGGAITYVLVVVVLRAVTMDDLPGRFADSLASTDLPPRHKGRVAVRELDRSGTA